jgi:hypothetical protein
MDGDDDDLTRHRSTIARLEARGAQFALGNPHDIGIWIPSDNRVSERDQEPLYLSPTASSRGVELDMASRWRPLVLGLGAAVVLAGVGAWLLASPDRTDEARRARARAEARSTQDAHVPSPAPTFVHETNDRQPIGPTPTTTSGLGVFVGGRPGGGRVGPPGSIESQLRTPFRSAKVKEQRDPPLDPELNAAEPIHDGGMARAIPRSIYCPPATELARPRQHPRSAAASTCPQETPPAFRQAATREQPRTAAPTHDPARSPPTPASCSTPPASVRP